MLFILFKTVAGLLLAQESALFLIAVGRWKKLFERDFNEKDLAIATQFHSIIDEFIREHAPNQVCCIEVKVSLACAFRMIVACLCIVV
jgi:endonuclease III-like uncharacterized protein